LNTDRKAERDSCASLMPAGNVWSENRRLRPSGESRQGQSQIFDIWTLADV